MEPREHRLKRLHMRSIRRGIKEMDIILTRFSEQRLHDLKDADLDLYEALLEENDQDLYQWVTGQVVAPERYASIMAQVVQSLPQSTV